MQTHNKSNEIVSQPNESASGSQLSTQTPERRALNSPSVTPSTPQQSQTVIKNARTSPFWWISLLHYCQQHGLVIVFCSSSILVAPVATKFLTYLVPPDQTASKQQYVSLADYGLLTVGMTLTDAQARLGRAVEVNRDETTATYKWANNDGSEITAIFKGDKLMRKQQRGVK